ncbi:hypothetical protein FBZ92_109159 [Nitrospirillum viridazoti]|uniref:Uncharacterized protein n=1 Tax=Nitrospirillum amazonense TaxID=28077 RepID=A0A560IHZ3_9PROT|nr:hypothetical protein FBZ92_109159 [Nitrospirillum amazonense]
MGLGYLQLAATRRPGVEFPRPSLPERERMKELRCIVFTDREVVSAITERRRKLNDAFPDGDVTSLEYTINRGVSARLSVTLNGAANDVTIPEQELQAALVGYCMSRNVPLPVVADKALYVIKGRATLMITMNFKKPARLVVLGVE